MAWSMKDVSSVKYFVLGLKIFKKKTKKKKQKAEAIKCRANQIVRTRTNSR